MSGRGPHRRVTESPATWRAAEVGPAGDWTVELTDDQRIEILDATRRLVERGAEPATVVAADFPLPGMADDIARWTAELADGRGFLLIRGFPVDRLDERGVELGYVGLGSHLGTPVGQTRAGDVLTHIRDERLADTAGVRLYRTNRRQDFHTDGADVIALLCLHGARHGGESRIVSTAALHDELVARRPDLVEVLHRPFPWDRQGEHQADESPWFELPPFGEVDGQLRVFYIGWYIRDSQQHPDAPRLSDAQLEAMDLVERIANDPDHHVEMDFRPGDIQLLNNARILHSREAYEDDPDLTRRRHLLRLWLAAHSFASVDEELRGGLGARS